MSTSKFSKQVAAVLNERGISFRSMSKDTGLGLATCHRIAHGIGDPRPRTVIIVCAYLDIPLRRDMVSGYVDEGELEMIRRNARKRVDFAALKNGDNVVVETR